MKINFCGALLLIFITLKLTSVIAWSWWWVLSPLWLPFAVIFGGGALMTFFGMAVVAFIDWKNKR